MPDLTPDYFETRAAKARRLAEQARDPDTRSLQETIAENYAELARITTGPPDRPDVRNQPQSG
jgi:hypothetical protein